jgi:F-box/WD-40 domain protein MET30
MAALCDTLPAPKLAPTTANEPVAKPAVDLNRQQDTRMAPTSAQIPARKLCPRHLRMADEGTNLKLQQVSTVPKHIFNSVNSNILQALNALPFQEREAVNTIWSNFSSSPHPRRALILQGLLTMCCFSQLSLLTEQLARIIRIDPFSVLPREISFKILGHLDAITLCRAAQVSRQWKSLADDDILWRGICEQHIGQKCLKCGWGLPRLEKKRSCRMPSASSSPCPESHDQIQSGKRPLEEDEHPIITRHLKRHKSHQVPDLDLPTQIQSPGLLTPPLSVTSTPSRPTTPLNPLVPPASPSILPEAITRPWKDVYSERLAIERNWRRGRCTLRTLQGHKDGVMCLQINENLSHPCFPILITGSYDRTVRVWNLETGAQIHCLEGHTSAVRALQFDEVKLVTGSMDHTLKIWNWRTGACLRTLEGHSEGVVCLNFDSTVLASGSVDTTIKIWNFKNGEKFTLRGHRDWVNAVQLWDTNEGPHPTPSASSSMSHNFDWSPGDYQPNSTSASSIDSGKMLFSASDDGTIRLWDLALRTCVRHFTGHVGQVQTLKVVYLDRPTTEEHNDVNMDESATPPRLTLPDRPESPSRTLLSPRAESAEPTQLQPVLVSGSLDNTIKIWDISTAKAVKTFFGHIEGVWAVASDKMRLISGSHDRTIKVRYFPY